MPRDLGAALANHVNRMINHIKRARELYDRIVVRGYTRQDEDYRQLYQPDRRDVSEFLFFEVAAAWEGFCIDTFLVGVRDEYGTTISQSKAVAGDPDRGLGFGWGDPRRFRQRAEELLGKDCVLSKLSDEPSNRAYQNLLRGYRIRNRIAHGRANDKYIATLKGMGLSSDQRRFLSPGRLLMDYPASAPEDERWLQRFLNAYETVAEYWNENLL